MGEKKSIKELVTEKNLGKIEYNDSAFGIARNSETGAWMLIEIPYNIEHNVTASIKVLSQDGEQALIIEKFKIEVANRNIVG